MTASISCDLLSVFFAFLHYAVYADDGMGSPGLKGIGIFLDVCAMLIFLLLLILVAKGWTITNMTIENTNTVLSILGGFAFLYAAMFIGM